MPKNTSYLFPFFIFVKILSFYHTFFAIFTAAPHKIGLKTRVKMFHMELSEILNVSRETINAKCACMIFK